MKTVLTLFLVMLFLSGASQDAAEHYDAALAKLNNGSTVKEVFQSLELCLDADSTYENAYFLKAYVYYKLEAFDAAILEYDRLLKINPYHREALKNRALTRIQMYDLDGAIEDHNRRLVLEPLNANIYFDRAYCRGLQKDLEGSIADYTRAIELNPGFTEAYASRGKAKMNLATSQVAKLKINSMEDACSDLQQARNMGDTTGSKLLSTYCATMSEK